MTEHQYRVDLSWQGNRGTGTSGYRDYGRQVVVEAAGKPALAGSADPTFRGDADRWNPEELLVVALSQCHLLSYLHMAARAGVVVTAYTDSPTGVMAQEGIAGQFTEVVLRPVVTIADPAQAELADSLHHEASEACFIARSVNFPVRHEPTVRST